jgi:hypothetical protein
VIPPGSGSIGNRQWRVVASVVLLSVVAIIVGLLLLVG